MCLLERGEVKSLTCVGENLSFSVFVARCWAEQAMKPDKSSSCLPHNKPAGLKSRLCHSPLHIQNQGIFAPLISVPPGPWNMGL